MWMNLKSIVLSERSLLKGYILYDTTYTTFWKDKNVETETKSEVNRVG